MIVRRFRVTGYCPCEKCGKNPKGISASGKPRVPNHTAAAPKIIPFGTKISFDRGGNYVVEDRGGSMITDSIEIFFPTHEKVTWFGTQFMYGHLEYKS